MRHSVRQFAAIAGLTALEAIRQPIFLILTTTCVVGIALLPLLVTHTLGEGEKMIRDSALALHFVCGLILGGYAACATLTHEIRRGTVGSVLSKPVNRGLFFIAKYAGIASVMMAFSAAATTATLLSVRMVASDYAFDWWAGGPLLAAAPLAYALAGLRNFLTRRPFVSSAYGLLLAAIVAAFAATLLAHSGEAGFSLAAALQWRILPAEVLIATAILVLSGLALTCAIRLSTVPTLTICSTVFMLGLMSDYLFGRHAANHRLAAVLYAILPNWQHFWATDALTGNGVIPWGYVAHAAVYAALYLAGILALGILTFRRVEVRS